MCLVPRLPSTLVLLVAVACTNSGPEALLVRLSAPTSVVPSADASVTPTRGALEIVGSLRTTCEPRTGVSATGSKTRQQLTIVLISEPIDGCPMDVVSDIPYAADVALPANVYHLTVIHRDGMAAPVIAFDGDVTVQ